MRDVELPPWLINFKLMAIQVLLEEEIVQHGVKIGFLFTLQRCISVALGHNTFKAYN